MQEDFILSWRSHSSNANVRFLSCNGIDVGMIVYYPGEGRWRLSLRDRRGNNVPLKAGYKKVEDAQEALGNIWKWELMLSGIKRST